MKKKVGRRREKMIREQEVIRDDMQADDPKTHAYTPLFK